jgi:hypothetical protein
MGIVLKDKIKIDKNFIDDLIAKSWQDSESIQNQIDSIEVDSAVAAKTVKLLKDLLTSYYVFTGCLENIENESIEVAEPIKATEPKVIVPKKPVAIPEEPVEVKTPEFVIPADEIDITAPVTNFNSTYNDTVYTDIASEPFEYFVDFDEPTGEPLTDDDLYN